MKKTGMFVAVLAILLAASAPLVLAQQNASEVLPPEPFLGGADGDDLFLSGDQAIDCGSVFSPTPQPRAPEEISSPVRTSPEADEELRRLCLENGYTPPNAGMQYQSEPSSELCIAPRPVNAPYSPVELEPCAPGVA